MSVIAKHKKDGSVKFTYKGDLQKAVDSASRELGEKTSSEKRKYLKYAKDEADRNYYTYERRISDLVRFIRLGNKMIEEKKAEQKNEPTN